jgi:hypothetical protein
VCRYGAAEMSSPIDHELRADFWQRDKWPGCFKVGLYKQVDCS